jgi:signal transduction histidine kinase
MKTSAAPASLWQSLFLRIAGSFILILLLIGAVFLFLILSTTRDYYDETTQRLNAGVAESMLQEVTPFKDSKVNEEAVGKIMHSMMAVNPGLEVYLLDPRGKILSFVVFKEKVRLNSVSMAPIERFLQTGGHELVYGDDPKNPGAKKVFSATPVYNEVELQGYVYLILESEKFDTIFGALNDSYLLKMGIQYFFLTLVSALLLTLLVLWGLTRNLRKVIHTVRQFEKGDLNARIAVDSNTEISALASTFNSMADTILRNIEELKQVDHLRRELIANVSHDIRTPISVMHGYAETMLIKEGNLEPGQRQEYLKIILKSAERLKQLVADLFELSKLEARQVTPKREVFFISDLLQDITHKYKLLAQQRNIELTTNLATRMPAVNADIAMIERVLQNLIDNALKFTPETGQVSITLEEKNENVEISVINTGVGIPEEKMERIFDRYYKEQKNSLAEGSGLGLAIVKNILQIHETDIRVVSEQLGLTKFSFTLPVQHV